MKPAPNATWEVKVPPIHNEDSLVVSPLRPKRDGFKKNPVVNLVPPMVLAAGDDCDGFLHSSFRGHESFSSFASVSTSSLRSPSCSPSVLSRKSASTSSTKSKSRRKKRRPSSTKHQTAFDPDRKPQKSCLKRSSKKSSSKQKESPPLRRNGSFYNIKLPGGQGTVKRQRTIQYNEQVFVREFRSAISLVDNRDPRVLWWQEDETASIKENLQRILSRVDLNGVARTNGKRYCTRGLERFLDPSTNCETDRLEAESAVFEEQNIQINSGNFDDLSIAAVYVRSTKSSQRKALRRGCEDAMAAASILGEGSMESALFRNSFSSGSLNVGKSLPTMNKSNLPKRSSSFSSFTSFARKPSSFRRKQQHKKKSAKSLPFSQHRPAVPSMA